MHIVNNTQAKFSTVFSATSRPKRGDWRATLIMKAAYHLVQGGICVPDETTTPAAQGDDPADGDMAPRYATDFVPFKPKTDLLVAATAHAAGGKPVARLRASIAVNNRIKSLAVIGDRHWTIGPLGAKPSEPAPFTKMPLGYERAFGGQSSRSNPVGRGAGVQQGQPLPNIEYLDRLIVQPTDRPNPAGFGPIGMTWKPRAEKLGTFNDTWKKTHWPWYPSDLDWSFFNSAPEDQQFPYFRGDEKLAFENMHPEHPVYQTRLPGVQARVFVERVGGAAFEEVAVKLDTVWVDVEAEKLVLLWRGVTRVASPRLRDISSVYATLEPLDAPAGIEAHHTDFLVLKDGPGQAAEAEASAQRAAIDEMRKAAEARIAEARSQVESARLTADSWIASTGLDKKRRELAAAQDPMAQLETAIAALKAHDPAKGRKLQDRLEDIDRRIGDVLGKIARPEAWNAQRVRNTMAEGGSLEKARLDGIDLDGVDLSGADLRGATLKGATLRNARLYRANLAGADFAKADVSEALFAEAELGRANFAEAVANGASFAGAQVEGAIFTKIQGNGADFSGAHGASVDFTEAVLNKARFIRANLPRAQFAAAQAAEADFSEAALPSADFAGAQAQGAILQSADLSNLRASRNADFTSGRFADASGPRSIWQQAKLDRADFSAATLSSAQFPEASLRGANFDKARLDHVSFEDAKLSGALLTRAHLLRASFERADLTDAVIDGCNLYGAGLLDATLERAKLRKNFVLQTLLAE